MFKKFLTGAALASVALTGIAATPAAAQRYQRGDYYGQGYGYNNGYNNGYYNQGDYRRQGYYNRNNYRGYRDCRRGGSGATGTILGGVFGGLLGREIDRGGGRGYYGRRNNDGTTGLIIGAGAGALAGNAIDRNGRCR